MINHWTQHTKNNLRAAAVQMQYETK